MYKAVIFDLGNVLINFSHDKMHKSMARVMGTTVDHLKQIIAENDLHNKFEKGTISAEIVLKYLQDNSPVNFSNEAMIQAFNDIFEDNLPVKNLLPQLKSQGLKTALISNTNILHIEWLKSQVTFFQYFETQIYSYEVHSLKPDKRIFQTALDKLQLKSSECIFIDDLQENISGANALGFQGLLFEDYPKLIIALKDCGIQFEK